MFIVLLRLSSDRALASVVNAEILELTPSRTDARLQFLQG